MSDPPWLFLPLLILLLGAPGTGGCGGSLTNARRGRLEAPPGGGRGLWNRSCDWQLEAPPGQRLRLLILRLVLDEGADRFWVRGGGPGPSPLLFDSDLDDVPRGGVLSPSPHLALRLLSEGPRQGPPPLLQLSYRAFPAGCCPPPRLPHGGVQSSDPQFCPGTLVTFWCHPGYRLGGGPQTLRCLHGTPPRWNDTPPLCTARCGGPVRGGSGELRPPPGPPRDCVWSIRLPEERRVRLRLTRLSLPPNSTLTLLDGEEVTGRVLGEFGGGSPHLSSPPSPSPTPLPLPLLSSGATVTLRYQVGGGRGGEEGGEDVGGSPPPPKIPPEPPEGGGEGGGGGGGAFVISYEGVPRPDRCPPLPGVPFSLPPPRRPPPVPGSVWSFRCRPGFRLRGPDLLTCQWDLSWSAAPPACRRVLSCPDPGEVPNSHRKVGDPRYPPGSRVRYSCHPGFLLEGSPSLTCHAHPPAPPAWSDPPPKCLPAPPPCLNPGVPANGLQGRYQQRYPPGQSLSFSCRQGYALLGEATVTCLPGSPSYWTSQPPICRASPGPRNQRGLEVTPRAGPGPQLEGGGIALATLLPLLLLLLLIGGAYVYYTKFQAESLWGFSFSSSHSYSPIGVESDLGNPLYEAGDTKEYEVSI